MNNALRWKLCGLCLVGLAMAGGAEGALIVSFDNPGGDPNAPVFGVDTVNDRITAGWGDDRTGLNLEVTIGSQVFADAWFSMSEVAYFGDESGGETGGGVLSFYADGEVEGIDEPVVRVSFNSGLLGGDGLGAWDLIRADGVVITGSAIPYALRREWFAFYFTDQVELPEGGFTAGASFAGHGVPEPVSVVLLGMGAVGLVRRKRRSGGDRRGANP